MHAHICIIQVCTCCCLVGDIRPSRDQEFLSSSTDMHLFCMGVGREGGESPTYQNLSSSTDMHLGMGAEREGGEPPTYMCIIFITYALEAKFMCFT
jgi:hypothetical protein